MQKLDLTQHYKHYYTAKAKPELVDIETARFLSITGKGDPSGKMFADKIQALYATAYAIKFSSKMQNKDFVVAKLEGLYTFNEQVYSGISIFDAPQLVPRSEWEYRLLIRLPEFVTSADIQSAAEAVVAKKQLQLASEIELFEMREGKSVQMLHVGPFDTEPDSLKQIYTFIQAHHLVKNGLHHEIYLSDFTKTPPQKLKTILREPVK